VGRRRKKEGKGEKHGYQSGEFQMTFVKEVISGFWLLKQNN